MKNDTKSVSKNSTRRLVEGVRDAYGAVSASPREQLRRFTWNAVNSLLNHHNFMLERVALKLDVREWEVDLVPHLGHRDVGFYEQREIFLEYIDAVRNAAPFEDLLSPIVAELTEGDIELRHHSAAGTFASGIRERDEIECPIVPTDERICLTLSDLQIHLQDKVDVLDRCDFLVYDSNRLRVGLMCLHLLANQIVHEIYIARVVLGVWDGGKGPKAVVLHSYEDYDDEE